MKRNSIYACAWLLLLGSATAQAQTSNPHPNPGDVTWMMLATVLVILMTIPGLALFYGGMIRAKNVLSVLTQVFVTFALIGLLWCFYGYSLAFTEGNAFFGGFDRAFLRGMTPDSVVSTFSIVGALLTGVFASPAFGGAGIYDYENNHVAPYDMDTQMLSQLWGVGVTIGWSGAVSLLSYALVDRVFRLRANEEQEQMGLDLASHGENAYRT